MNRPMRKGRKMESRLGKIKIPHVFVLLLGVIFFTALMTYITPAGQYERVEKKVGSLTRNVVQPGTYQTLPKHYSIKAIFLGDKKEGYAEPESLLGFLSSIPRGMQDAADIIFFIFIIGGTFGILQRSGMIAAFLHKLLDMFGHSSTLLTIIIMTVVAVGGSTLGMGEEFIPLVPIFLIVSKEMGFDRIYGLALVMLAADVGFAAATTNPFTVNIAQGIAELPLNSDVPFRAVFLVVILFIAISYTLRYGRRIKKDPSASYMPDDNFDLSHLRHEKQVLNAAHIRVMISSIVIFVFILYAVQTFDWWLNEMSAAFLFMGIMAAVFSRMSVKDASHAFVKGMEEMVVAALVVGFARGIQVVLQDGQILDTVIHGAATSLKHFHNIIAAQGMLIFQTVLNFFIPSGSGQAAVTMPLMAPLADVLGLSRETAVFAFTCGDGFSNSIIPTSGVLMAMLSLARIPLSSWWRFMMPLFGQLMLASAVFLTISVYIY
ncbi:MAG TPA: putative basic amino acid antiporter YfcC [Caldithrix abyssi]|uniref:Basic amino acid antiporter YfcC n=1 Tax=Caldithrix abyssi TaxID=187145 RepID=A0A7V5RPL9_CALAY|nr:putative basic amino acid antiporter YfcC [Caldithrix abyssi]